MNDENTARNLNAEDKLKLPIARESWFPLLRYEALTRPAGASTLRGRLKQQGYDASLAKVQEAIDFIDPQTAESKVDYPEECSELPSQAGSS